MSLIRWHFWSSGRSHRIHLWIHTAGRSWLVGVQSHSGCFKNPVSVCGHRQEGVRRENFFFDCFNLTFI